MENTNMNKWPKHIEECLAASIEHGPDAEFACDEVWSDSSICQVLTNVEYAWKLIPPPKPDVEQWGHEYVDVDMGNRIQFQPSLAWANKCSGPGCIAVHHRIIDGETGMTKFFETLEVIK